MYIPSNYEISSGNLSVVGMKIVRGCQGCTCIVQPNTYFPLLGSACITAVRKSQLSGSCRTRPKIAILGILGTSAVLDIITDILIPLLLQVIFSSWETISNNGK